MANGPLGGFMPTPAAPAQPPQVKLDTTADSRGNFNNFLKNMNGALSVNPPVMAPAMGAMTPNIAPTDNIDIFNQPVQMMQFGGSAMSGGAFSDAEIGEAIDSFDDNQQDNNFDENFTEEEDPERAGDFRTDDDNIFIESGGGDLTSVPKVKFDNETILNATKDLPEGNEAQRAFKRDTIATLQDYAKDNDLAGALNEFQIAAVAGGDKRGENIVNSIIQASNVNPAFFSAAVFNQPDKSGILSLGDKKITDLAKTPGSLTDSGLRGSLTPGASQDVIDTAKNAIRASAGNNQAIDNLVAQFGSLDPSIGQLASRTKSGIGQIGEIKPGDVEDLSGTPTTLPPPTTRGGSTFGPDMDALRSEGALVDQIFDLETTGDREFRIPDSQSELDQAPSLSRLGFPSSKIPNEFDSRNITETALGARNLAGEPPPIVAPGIGTPKEFRDEFTGAGIKIGNVTIPTIFSLANQFSKQQRGRVLDSIAQKGYTPVYGGKNNDIIVGARDPNTGILMEGIDPNQELGGDDSGPDPIIRPLTPKPEEPKPELPPNVIGETGGQLGGLQPVTADTVVASPFAPAASNIQPVTFDSGQLNRLIELLTGTPARPVVSAKKGGLIGMANGGLIKAVDDFLAAS